MIDSINILWYIIFETQYIPLYKSLIEIETGRHDKHESEQCNDTAIQVSYRN